MKIGQIQTATAPAAVGTSDRKPGQATRNTPAAASSGPSESSTQVELSATASALGRSDGDETFDSAKVDRIAQAIKDGKFTVNHQAIADKLISNAQELLGRAGSSH